MLNSVTQKKSLDNDDSLETKRVKPLKSLKIKNKILKKMQDYDEF